MENKPLISILMNCYNGEEYLREAIDSVFIQDYDNWEILFIDNCSTDRSAEIAMSYNDDRIRYFKTDVNIPLGPARNFGIKFMRGQYITFLDTDDVWVSDKLSSQLSYMIANKDVLSYTNIIEIDAEGKEIGRRTLSKDGASISSQLVWYTITMQSVMIDVSAVGKITLNEGLAYCPDYDLFMDILFRFPNSVGLVEKYLVKYRIHYSLSHKLIDLQYDEILSVLRSLEQKYPETVAEYKSEFKRSLIKCRDRKAESFIVKDKFYDAAKIYFSMISADKKYFVKGVIALLPFGLNKYYFKKILSKKGWVF